MVGQQSPNDDDDDDEEQAPTILLLHKRHPGAAGYGATAYSDDEAAAAVANEQTTDDDDDEEEATNPRAAAFREARHSYLSFTQPVGANNNPYYNTNNGGGGGFFNSVRAYYTVRDTVLSHTFVFDRGLLASVREAEGTATVPASVLNLCKNVIGAGALVRTVPCICVHNTPRECLID